MTDEIRNYNNSLSTSDREICDVLANKISQGLPEAENKIWHAHPVWFLQGNQIVGYSKLKNGVRLMFWSGASFDDKLLKSGTGKFKDASILYTSADEVNIDGVEGWLQKSQEIQWDYKNVVKRKGVLERLRPEKK